MLNFFYDIRPSLIAQCIIDGYKGEYRMLEEKSWTLDKREKWQEMSLGRFGKSEEVADVVTFLASQRA